MFRFEQKPDESGHDVRKRFLIELMLYSYSEYKQRNKVAKFLGMSNKGISNIINRYKELNHLKKSHNIINKSDEYFNKRRMYDDKGNQRIIDRSNPFGKIT